MSSKKSKKKKGKYAAPTIKSLSEKGLTKDTQSAFMTGGCAPGGVYNPT